LAISIGCNQSSSQPDPMKITSDDFSARLQAAAVNFPFTTPPGRLLNT